MLTAFFGKKLYQTQMFTADGKRIPVTTIRVSPGIVTQVKTDKTDGYWAVQLGFESKSAANITKQIAGHLKKTGKDTLPRFLREIKFIGSGEEVPFKIGDTVTFEQVFQPGETVKVTGTSKAKGFQGGVKRHGFRGGSRTHGQSDRERAPGSIGQTTTPGRVYRGKRMAGRMGGDEVTIRGLEIVSVDPEKQVVTVKGLVPGRVNKYVFIKKQSMTSL